MLSFCDFIQVYVFTTNHHLNLVPERTSGMKNENKGLRITYFINFLASSLFMQISYEAL